MDIVRGANMSFRVPALKEVRGFDETYERGTWGEETDPQLALRRRGYRIVYDPRLRVDHYMAGSGGNRALRDPANLGKIAYGNARNQVYLLRKHGLLTSRYAWRWFLWSLASGAEGLRAVLLSDESAGAPSEHGSRSRAVDPSWRAFFSKAYNAFLGWSIELIAPSPQIYGKP